MQIKIKLALLGGDVVLLTACIAMACYLRLDDATLIYNHYPTATSFCLLTYPLCLYLTRSYEVQPQAGSLESLRRPLLGLLIAIAASSLFFYLAPQVRFGRGIFAIVNGLLIFTLPVWRFAIFRLLRHRRLNFLLMGNPAAVEMACELIRSNSPFSHVRVWQPESPAADPPDLLNSSGDDSPAAEQYDLLILAGHSLDPATLRKAAALRLKGVAVWNLPRLWSEFDERLPARFIDERWIVSAEGFRSLNDQSFEVIKQLVDVCASFVGLVLFLPLLALAALAIKLQDGGAVFYSQERMGKGGKIFRVYKLRTMVKGAEEITGPVWALRHDPRVTPVGRWLRKVRIDEIPQMWNVLKGEMSFVGPRPERPVFVEALQSKFPAYSLRHLVRPGITGWAQVRCPYGASEDDALLKLEYDLYYLQNASLLFDLRILLKTISIVASGWGSW